MPVPSGWTEERVEMLKKHLADGLSCSAIAAELGGVTRNGVIGKIHRLGLQPKHRPGPAPRQPRQPRGHRVGKLYRETAIAAARREALTDLEPENVADAVTLLELEAHHCRWPVNDAPAGLASLFCGAGAIDKLPYCARHCRMAYRAPEPPRSRARTEIATRTAIKNFKERAA